MGTYRESVLHFRLIVAFGILLLSPRHVCAVDVDCAHPAVPPNAVGDLVEDIVNCPGGRIGVRIGRNASLNMHGHTIILGGIECQDGKCAVNGPGIVTGAGTGIYAVLTRKLVVTDVDLSGNGAGIYQPDGKMIVSGVTVNDNPNGGIVGDRIFATDVTANNNGTDANPKAGIDGDIVRVTDVTASGNKSVGISGHRRVLATNVTANDNSLLGIGTARCKLRQVSASGNEHGVSCSAGLIDSSIITGNSVVDILAGPNGPRVRNSTCVNSFRPGNAPFPGVPAGLCSAN